MLFEFAIVSRWSLELHREPTKQKRALDVANYQFRYQIGNFYKLVWVTIAASQHMWLHPAFSRATVARFDRVCGTIKELNQTQTNEGGK